MLKRSQKGITLIVLVVTIIVLLILAGISIATLTGDNGILSKANTAGEESKKKEYEEVIKLIANGLRADKYLSIILHKILIIGFGYGFQILF